MTMAVNTRTEYALRALLEIPYQDGESVSAQTICSNQQLPKKYIEHLLSSLKNAGLITSSSGSRGGYNLARPAEEISLYDIMAAVRDHTLELDCTMGKQFCLGRGCGLQGVFSDLGSKQRELFQGYSLARIAEIFGKEIK
jgi:Rrf2 family protein